FSVGRGAKSLVNDVVWTVLLLGVLVGLLVTGSASVTNCVLAFGGTATLAAAFGLLQCRIRPQPTSARAWVVEHRALGGRYLVENVSNSGARQLRAFALGALAGLANVGDVRAAELLMGPFLVIVMGVSQVAVPEAARVLVRAPRLLAPFCFGLGAVQALAAAVWGVAILALLPIGIGDALFGPIWVPASALLPPVIIAVSISCFSVGAAAGLRAMGAARRSMAAQLMVSGLYVIGGVGGAVLAGAPGTCWGVAVATTLGALVWWAQLRSTIESRRERAVPSHGPVPTGSTS
ncbi:MAG: hypothetical protein M3P23_07110, partial [Actinomycetota bacterium]|nr:hypothetical protein [Actinomycetota bacterium]